MYKDKPLPASILIVKTSSLGDIIQTFSVLDELHQRFPDASLDWAVEAYLLPIVAAHPLIRRAIPLDIKGKSQILKDLKSLRQNSYDLIFDFQGNCKSGLITLLARGKVKVGYGLKSVREWPNILATHQHFNVSKQKSIRAFYLGLIESYFKAPAKQDLPGVRFHISDEEKKTISHILSQVPKGRTIMVCPGSKWANKQLKTETLLAFLQKIEGAYGASFLLIWGDEMEKKQCSALALGLKRTVVVDKLTFPAWQNLMSELDLVIAVDSSALHLCATTATPSFSIFGPTSPNVFKPLGPRHVAIQGKCPYGKVFEKQCPILRSCPTGACIKDLTAEELFAALQNQRAFLQL